MLESEQRRREHAQKIVRPGDVILYKSDSKFYTHASIVDFDREYQLEAKWLRTRKSKIHWMDERRTPEIWRPKWETEDDPELAVRWAKLHLGIHCRPAFLLFGWRPSQRLITCSQYVHDSVYVGHVILVPNNRRVSPYEITESSKIVRVA